MQSVVINKRIPDEQLADYWFDLRHAVFEQLTARFRESGLRQKDIAERLGQKSEARVSKWLNGRENLTLRTMSDIARAIGCRLEVRVRPLKDISKIPNDHFDQRVAYAKSHPTLAGTAKVNTSIFTSSDNLAKSATGSRGGARANV